MVLEHDADRLAPRLHRGVPPPSGDCQTIASSLQVLPPSFEKIALTLVRSVALWLPAWTSACLSGHDATVFLHCGSRSAPTSSKRSQALYASASRGAAAGAKGLDVAMLAPAGAEVAQATGAEAAGLAGAGGGVGRDR